MSRMLAFALLAACAGTPPTEKPRPLAKFPDDADPVCAGGCYLFTDDTCKDGCRMAHNARQRHERARAQADAVAESEYLIGVDHGSAESIGIVTTWDDGRIVSVAPVASKIPAKTRRRRAKKAAGVRR